MRCKAVVALPVMTINGKKYREGDVFGEVVISDREYKTLNSNPSITGLKYEEIKDSNPIRDEADRLGIQYRNNISDEKLQEKINELKKD